MRYVPRKLFEILATPRFQGRVAWATLFAMVLAARSVSAALTLEIQPTPVNFYLQDSPINAQVIRRGTSPGELNHQTTVTVSSGDTGVFTVPSPTIIMGPTSALAQTNLVQLVGIAEGSAEIFATATGYTSATNTVNVNNQPALDMPATRAMMVSNTVQVTVTRQGPLTTAVTVTVSRLEVDDGIFLIGDNGTNATWDVLLMPVGSNAATFSVYGAAVTDPLAVTITASAPGYESDTCDMTVYGEAPVLPATVMYVTSTNADGAYFLGEVVDVSIRFSEAVGVAGGPAILFMETGPTDLIAVYVSGDGTDTLHFNMTVSAGAWTTDIGYLATNSLFANGAAITNVYGVDADLRLPAPGGGGSLSSNKNISVYDIDGDADPDGDGASNRDELAAGTAIDDRSSVFVIESNTIEPSGRRIEWQSVSGKTYSVEYTDSLQPANWITPSAWAGIVASGSSTSIDDDGSETGGLSPVRFYRIRLVE